MKLNRFIFLVLFVLAGFTLKAQNKPNVVIIYADDLGYGDLSSYGATKIETPHIDRLSGSGLRFTNAHATSATCTPSRYALMTGRYPWRKSGTGVLPGDAALIVPTDKVTLPKMFKTQGYATGIVGKWHLGLGTQVEKNWNGKIAPGPLETGFDYAFIFPATADRVPTVFIENHYVVALSPHDSIEVNYKHKVGNEPTGKENPELLKMKSSHGHDNTIWNGIGRIGFMSGGKTARWTDEEMPMTFLYQAHGFINRHQHEPFFLYFTPTEPHVPRMPSTMFKGKSKLGFRGDTILQLDWAVGQIIQQLEQLHLLDNTIIILSSDNGPVLDDGYVDGAVTQQQGHLPAGPLRGGKYSIFEGGTRVPFIISWPNHIIPGESDALICQMDMLASFASFFNQKAVVTDTLDSENIWPALMGRSPKGRDVLVEHAGSLAIIHEDWKYIRPSAGKAMHKQVNIELGNSPEPQLYNLGNDIGEKRNLASENPLKVRELEKKLQAIEGETPNKP